MSSGKQLSFQYGEVSPSLRFRSDAVSYSQGLSKLKNMYVRNAGGVSNRSGFVHVKTHEYQGELMVDGSTPGIKGMVFFDPVNRVEMLLEYRRRTTAPLEYAFFKDGNTTPVPSSIGPISFDAPSPEVIRYTVLKDEVLFTPSLRFSAIPPALPTFTNPVYRFLSGFIDNIAALDFFFITATATGFVTGTVLLVPVTYKITGVFEDGRERDMFTFGSPPTYSPGTILFPQSNAYNNVSLTFLGTIPNLKFFNVYRATGFPTDPNLFFKLAQRIRYGGGTLLKFTDFTGEDASQTAPEEITLYGKAFPALVGANTATIYQQRLLLSYDEVLSNGMKPGEVGASRLGAPTDLRMPLVFNNTGAFQFSVPVEDNTPIVGFLPMERLIVLTERRTYIIRGGEQGALSPTSVNPLIISETGCSRVVEPKMKGRSGFYLDRDHTKLMAVVFGDDANVRVFDVSAFADHLFAKDVFTMEVVGGREDRVFLLKRDGTMVQITVGDNSVGFSTVETNGFIENIYVRRELKPYVSPRPSVRNDPTVETLYAYVIRDGVRYVEKMVFRDDDDKEGMFYADNSSGFGERLAKNTNNSWLRTTAQVPLPATYAAGAKLNIRAPGTFDAGDTIFVESSLAAPALSNDYRIDFFIELNGVVERFRFSPVISGSSGDVNFPFRLTGTFDKDVPPELQDVFAQSISAAEKESRHSRFTVSYKTITGLTHLANKQVSVFADGNVLSSPLNPLYPTALTVNGSGVLTLPDYYAWGVVGLPYESEMETLDLEASDGRTFTDANKLINAAGVAFDKTRGGFISIESQAATSLSDASPLAPDDDPSFPAERPSFSDHIEVPIPAQWSKRGRVNVRQVDPLPLTVLSVYPKGMVSN